MADEADIDRLELIVEMIDAAERRVAATTKVQFVEDGDEIDLMAFRLPQIGEGCSRLSPGLRSRYPEIEWAKIRGMRNLIVHEYRRVIPGRLWDAAEGELRPLYKICRIELDRAPE